MVPLLHRHSLQRSCCYTEVVTVALAEETQPSCPKPANVLKHCSVSIKGAFGSALSLGRSKPPDLMQHHDRYFSPYVMPHSMHDAALRSLSQKAKNAKKAKKAGVKAVSASWQSGIHDSVQSTAGEMAPAGAVPKALEHSPTPLAESAVAFHMPKSLPERNHAQHQRLTCDPDAVRLSVLGAVTAAALTAPAATTGATAASTTVASTGADKSSVEQYAATCKQTATSSPSAHDRHSHAAATKAGHMPAVPSKDMPGVPSTDLPAEPSSFCGQPLQRSSVDPSDGTHLGCELQPISGRASLKRARTQRSKMPSGKAGRRSRHGQAGSGQPPAAVAASAAARHTPTDRSSQTVRDSQQAGSAVPFTASNLRDSASQSSSSAVQLAAQSATDTPQPAVQPGSGNGNRCALTAAGNSNCASPK